jgi:hypothetical protein
VSQYSAMQTGFTPTVSATNVNSNVLYNTVTGAVALVKAINWGGSDTSLVAQVSRCARVTNTPATPTAITIQTANVAAGPAPISLAATFGTAATAATSASGNSLFMQNWNSQGGGGVVILPIGGEWIIVGGALGTAGDAIGWGSPTGGGANLSFGFIFAE